jgi:hypothetical protein
MYRKKLVYTGLRRSEVSGIHWGFWNVFLANKEELAHSSKLDVPVTYILEWGHSMVI